jgi:hypothetical protein
MINEREAGRKGGGGLTGSVARSAREAATMAREASGAPHVSTILAAPAGFVWASTTETSGRYAGVSAEEK